MTTRVRSIRPLLASALVASSAALVAAGCGSPSKANIALRKENAELRGRLEVVDRQRQGDLATIRALESRATTVPVLPAERVDELFAVHGLKFGRLTGGADLDPSAPGDEGLKVYVTPTDRTGDDLKAAGSFVVEAFDLTQPSGEVRVGRWEFDTAAARDAWRSFGLLYEYVLELPWQQAPPRSSELTLRVTFTDALTGRTFAEQRVVRVNPPPATNPVAQTAGERAGS
jgi:hypothetical protein